MNFKKLSITSVGLAVLLFSCAGKVELSKDKMQSEIDSKYDEQYVRNTYSVGKQVKYLVTSSSSPDTEDEILTIEGIERDEDGVTVIKLRKSEEVTFSMPILDSATLNVLSATPGTRFYKAGSDYLVSASQDGTTSEMTFGKDFVNKSAKFITGGETINATYTLLP